MAELTRADLGIWLINLDRDTDRLTAMQRQLDAIGLEYTRFPAIYGKDHAEELAARVDQAAYARNMGRPILAGDMGCYASHVAVWDTFVSSTAKIALILEDDVVFHDDFLDSLDIALAGAAHWDTLRFNCIRSKIPISQGRLGGYTLNAYLGPSTGTATYLIKKEMIERFAPNIWPQTRTFDHELNRIFIHDYRQFGLEPFSSHVDDGGVSTITGESFQLVKKFPWYQRLPYYRLKAQNYIHRARWLLKNQRLFPNHQKLK